MFTSTSCCKIIFYAGNNFHFFSGVIGNFEDYIRLLYGEARNYGCALCGKEFRLKHHVTNHIESVHFPGTSEYTCSTCTAVFNTRNKLHKHNFKFHRDS